MSLLSFRAKPKIQLPSNDIIPWRSHSHFLIPLSTLDIPISMHISLNSSSSTQPSPLLSHLLNRACSLSCAILYIPTHYWPGECGRPAQHTCHPLEAAYRLLLPRLLMCDPGTALTLLNWYNNNEQRNWVLFLMSGSKKSGIEKILQWWYGRLSQVPAPALLAGWVSFNFS